MENSRVKISSEHSFKAGPASGVMLGLSPRIGKLYRTGERQFTLFYIHKMFHKLSRYALPLFLVPIECVWMNYLLFRTE
jgi:hypothetical protein